MKKRTVKYVNPSRKKRNFSDVSLDLYIIAICACLRKFCFHVKFDVFYDIYNV